MLPIKFGPQEFSLNTCDASVAQGLSGSLSLDLNNWLMDCFSLIHLFTEILAGKSLSNFCLKVAEFVKEPVVH